MQRLITLGFSLDLLADFASLWIDASGLELTTSLVLGALPAAAALYTFASPADGLSEFRAETIRR